MDWNHKIWGHHASKFGIIYSNGGHLGFHYTHTSLSDFIHFVLEFVLECLNMYEKINQFIL